MTFEKRIAATLSNRDIKSDALADLIVETEAAIAAAEKEAEAERAKALDPLQSPEADAAHASMQSAEFAVQRLRTMLPRLQQRYQQVAGAEEYAAWAATFDALKPKHAAAAAKLRAVCTEFEAKLVEALSEAKQVDAEVRRVASVKPYRLAQSNNDGRNLSTVECAARRLTAVNPEYSVMQLRLPSFNEPNKFAWPPYETPLAVQVAASMVPVAGDPRRYSARWWELDQEQRQAAREQRRLEQQEQEAEALARHHGPRWWERTGS